MRRKLRLKGAVKVNRNFSLWGQHSPFSSILLGFCTCVWREMFGSRFHNLLFFAPEHCVASLEISCLLLCKKNCSQKLCCLEPRFSSCSFSILTLLISRAYFKRKFDANWEEKEIIMRLIIQSCISFARGKMVQIFIT